MRLSIAATVACLSIVGLSAADEVKAAIRKDTNIPAQGLGPALQLLAKDRGFQIVYVSDEVNSLRTQGASGELTPEEALAKLLSGTGMTYAVFGENSFSIVSVAAASPPFAPSTSSSSGTDVSSQLPERQLEEKKSFWDRFRLAQVDQGNDSSDVPVGDQNKNDSSRQNGESRPSRIEEVVVTATKRAENVQDVPISITAISADEIDRRGLVDAGDYLRGVPGVNQVEGGPFAQAVVIRGIETSPEAQNFSSGTTVATYFGETPTTSSAGLAGATSVDLKLVDIERVEILRGPQGTAFGSSSLGGAVRTIPVVPRFDGLEGKAAVGYSNTSGTSGDSYNVQAVGNIPIISDKLAIRAVAYKYQDAGFYRNRAGSDAAFQAAVVTPFGAEAFAADQEEVGSYDVTGGRVATLFQPSDDLRFTLSYLSQKTETDGMYLANSGAYEQTLLQVAPEHVRRGQKGGFDDSDIDLLNATVDYDLGWGDLFATYSYVKSDSINSFPFGYVGIDGPLSYGGNSGHREDVGEIRLATQFDGVWNFLAGLYVEEHDDKYLQTYYWHGDPATNFIAPGERFMGESLDQHNLKQKAAFTEISWQFLSGWTLTGGARVYNFDRTIQVESTGALLGNAATTNNVDASGNSFRGNLSYKLGDNALLYAGWSQGFRLGKPQPGLPAGACDLDGDSLIDGTNNTIESTRSIDSDTVDSYEFGAKFMLLDRRVTIDAAVFRIEWLGVPVRVAAPSPPAGCALAYNTNAGEALSEGVEFQANFQINAPFRVNFGGSWIDARLTEDVPAQGFSAGNRLLGSPKVNANLGLQYDFDIGGYKASLRGDSIYVGSFYGDLLESVSTEAGDYVKLDASLRAVILSLSIDLFVRNLTDEDAFTFRRPGGGEFYGHRLRPRTIGLQLGYIF